MAQVTVPACGVPLGAGTLPYVPAGACALPTVPPPVFVGVLVPLLPQAARAVAPAIASIATVDAGRANFIDSPRCQGTDPRPGWPGSRWRASHRAVEPWLAASPVPARVQPGFGENHKDFPSGRPVSRSVWRCR